MTRADVYALATLAGMTILLVVLISPFFEVAQDDSWNFALPTKHFLETGRPTFDPFNSAASVLHILWGGLFCLIFEFSFSVCRIANICLGLISSMLLYFALRQGGSDEKISFAGTAAFAANPIMMVTAYTYQSDIAYLACAFGAAGFYLRYMRTMAHGDLIAATLIASISVWNKLHGMLLPIGALVYFVIVHRKAGIKGIRWITITVIPAIFILGFHLAKPLVHPVSTTLDGKMAEFNERILSPWVWLSEGTWRMFFIIAALGLYCLPFLAGWKFMRKGDDGFSRGFKISVALFWVVALKIGFHWLSRGMDHFDDVYPFHSSMLRESPALPVFWIHHILSWLAWPAGALIGYHLTIAAIKSLKDKGVNLLLFGLLIPQILILVPILLFMDRYFLVLIPLAFLILAQRFTGTEFKLVYCVVIITLSFAFGAVRISQYKAGNVALWQGAKVLTDRGISNLNIDAGYAWTGWHNYEHSLANPHIDRSKPGDAWYIHKLCRTTDVKYLVTFAEPPPGTENYEEFDYRYWLGLGIEKVYIYQRPDQ